MAAPRSVIVGRGARDLPACASWRFRRSCRQIFQSIHFRQNSNSRCHTADGGTLRLSASSSGDCHRRPHAIWHRRCQHYQRSRMASHRIPFESLSAAERNRLMADNDRLRQQLRERHRMADLAGNSGAIRRVCELIAQIAPSSHSVCLQGEDGVGKTRAVRAIHAASPRSAAAARRRTARRAPTQRACR